MSQFVLNARIKVSHNWWLIELPFWFKACLLSKMLRILTTQYAKVISIEVTFNESPRKLFTPWYFYYWPVRPVVFIVSQDSDIRVGWSEDTSVKSRTTNMVLKRYEEIYLLFIYCFLSYFYFESKATPYGNRTLSWIQPH